MLALSRSILIVDDSLDDREMYVRFIGKSDGPKFECIEAASGNEAVECVRSYNPACILLDYSLPGKDGLAVLNDIMATRPEIPVIMLTGQGSEDIAVKAMKAGAKDYLTKSGLTPDLLNLSISRILNAKDIAELVKRQKSKIQDHENYMHALVNHLKDGLFTIDENGSIETFNQAACEIFAIEPQNFTGKNIKDLIPDFSITLKNENNVELSAVRNDMEKFPIEISLSSVKMNNRHIYSALVRDITERKLAEEKILQSNEDLERFAYIASHDLKEPLRAISVLTGMMQKDIQGTEISRKTANYMKLIDEATERMRALIHDLLDYSRLSDDNDDVTVFNTRQEIEKVLETMHETIESAGVEIRMHTLPEKLYTNQVRFNRLMQNLLSNAIKFRDKCRSLSIDINAEPEENFWKFSVKDNGIGIESTYHEQIFGFFKRLHSKKEYEGSGIGLAASRRIVEALGGKIWVESEQGNGSVFYFLLPRNEA